MQQQYHLCSTDTCTKTENVTTVLQSWTKIVWTTTKNGVVPDTHHKQCTTNLKDHLQGV